MPRIPPELCTRCKGYRLLCGLPSCPILDRLRSQARSLERARWSREVQGSTPPSILVGERGYPGVRLYYMVPPGVAGPEAQRYEDPLGWRSSRTPLGSIVRLRSELVAGVLRADARRPHELLYQREIGPAALSERPVDSFLELARLPVPRVSFDGYTKPVGPTAPARRVEVEGNPRLEKPVERAIWEDEKAEVMAWELFNRGVNVYTIQRALSIGFLGRLRARRLVPTRWAITAVDEMLSRRLRRLLKTAPEIGGVEVYFSEYLHNRFLIILKPGPGWMEWIEIWHPHTVWTPGAGGPVASVVREDPLGRKNMEDGGFSAAKLPVLEHLYSRGRRADVIIVREVLPQYYAPVGNWHIRETVKHALAQKPLAKNPQPGELDALASKLIGEWGLAKRISQLMKPRKTLESYMD
ncbi:conserved hypothetical protein [Aeropyrum pernix K1]|uniref:DNA repair protein n=1 Tax=Aeropyrum pernix (strain ATCC 700893 / DSM 11879 / JCM 9820 / NBRC 100138 / K1) TaxID=272557 RepID=Q9YAE1_AERPE|nr:Nre family DNA repair protein [Aeropyrum pernix]BAA81008.1 conserved hypothetical protein [Aeropyrum pernix K1]